MSEFDALKLQHTELKATLQSTIVEREQKEEELNSQIQRERSQREEQQTQFEQKISELIQEKEKLVAQHNENQSEIDLLASQLQIKSADLLELETSSGQAIQEKTEEIMTLRTKVTELENEREVNFFLIKCLFFLSFCTFQFQHALLHTDSQHFCSQFD